MKKIDNIMPTKPGSSSVSPVGELEGALRATGSSPTGGGPFDGSLEVPDPEVPEKKSRRKFTAAYKLRILEEADQCTEPGQIGALLRREGLYSSNLTTWRKQRETGVLNSLGPKKRGRKSKPKDPSAKRITELEKENIRLKQQLKKAETIIDAQKKISELFGIDQNLNEGENEK